MKRSYGWDRTMIDTTEGARTCGHGAFAHNLSKIATLPDPKSREPATSGAATEQISPSGRLTDPAVSGRIAKWRFPVASRQ